MIRRCLHKSASCLVHFNLSNLELLERWFTIFVIAYGTAFYVLQRFSSGEILIPYLTLSFILIESKIDFTPFWIRGNIVTSLRTYTSPQLMLGSYSTNNWLFWNATKTVLCRIFWPYSKGLNFRDVWKDCERATNRPLHRRTIENRTLSIYISQSWMRPYYILLFAFMFTSIILIVFDTMLLRWLYTCINRHRSLLIEQGGTHYRLLYRHLCMHTLTSMFHHVL